MAMTMDQGEPKQLTVVLDSRTCSFSSLMADQRQTSVKSQLSILSSRNDYHSSSAIPDQAIDEYETKHSGNQDCAVRFASYLCWLNSHAKVLIVCIELYSGR